MDIYWTNMPGTAIPIVLPDDVKNLMGCGDDNLVPPELLKPSTE